MADICVRKVAPEMHDKIKEDSYRRMITMQDVVKEALAQYFSDSQQDLFSEPVLPISSPPSNLPLSFIDVFAGIGGFRIGMERLGAKCVFTSEWDVHSQRTYKAWHGEQPYGDITKIPTAEIPDHDILCAGFPCQPFSLAGVSKKNSLGKKHGFKDETQGTLFFHLVNIAEIKRPPVMILENVKNLMSHDKGRTWQVIQNNLEALNYQVFSKIIDAKHWVPQHRERIFIVCFDRHEFGSNIPFTFPTLPVVPPQLRSILEAEPDPKYTLSDHLWNYLQAYAEKHRLAGNGFGFGLADLNGCSRTLSARYHKDGSEILIPQEGKNPRRLTPLECQRLLGYPDHLPQVVSDTQAYRQFGNSIVPSIVEAVGRQVLEVIEWHIRQRGSLLKRTQYAYAKALTA